GHANLAVRISAMNQLVERGGEAAVAAIRKLMAAGATVPQRVCGLWVLHRKGALDDATLLACAGDRERELRAHSLKARAERSLLSQPFSDLATARLTDPDPFVRRAAAEVLGVHPERAHIRPLLALRQSTAADDTHLLHVARMALRDQLQSAETWDALANLGLSERDWRDIADVATGVHSSQAAAFLLAHLKRFDEPMANQTRYFHHVARYGAPALANDLVALDGLKRKPAAEQLEPLRATQQGAQERGGSLEESARREGARLAGQLLGSDRPEDVSLGIDAVRDFGFREMQGELKKVIGRRGLAEGTRMHAMAALAVMDPRANLGTIAGVLADASASLELRASAAGLLGTL